jgi:hypothetical protein
MMLYQLSARRKLANDASFGMNFDIGQASGSQRYVYS